MTASVMDRAPGNGEPAGELDPSLGSDRVEPKELKDPTVTYPEALMRADLVLREADKSLPALHVSVHHEDGTRFPQTWVGFGQTKAGEGLVPTEKTEYHIEGRPKKAGLAVPLIESSQQSVTYFGLSRRGSEEDTEDGWWQHWYKNGLKQYDGNGRVVYSNDYDQEVGFDDIATWFISPVGGSAFHAPFIITDGAVHDTLIAPQSLARRRQSEFIALGDKAVQAFFNATLFKPVRDTNSPQPFKDMLDMVADNLGVKTQ